MLFQEYTPFKFVCLLYIGQSIFTLPPHVSSNFAWSLEKITLKIMKILRTTSLESNFTGFYTKKSVQKYLVMKAGSALKLEMIA